MKKLLLAFFLLLIGIVCTYPQRAGSTGETLYCWAQRGINIRERPDVSARISGRISYRQSCILQEETDVRYTDTLVRDAELSLVLTDNWLYVRAGEKSGYVFGAYLSARPVGNLYGRFGNISPQAGKDTLINGKKAHCARLYAADKSVYTQIQSDGCETEIFDLNHTSLNEALLLLRESFPEEEPEHCPFRLQMISRDTWYFESCEATSERTIMYRNGKLRITLVNCT